MSQNIDDRIVALEFDNKQFESGAKQSLQTLEELKSSMKFDDMNKNLANFGKNAAKSFDLSKLQSGVDALRDRFSASGIAGMEVIKRLTNFAMDAGKKITSTLAKPLDTMFKGGWDRAANIENAKFQIEGLGVAFSELEKSINDAVAGTAYGFDAAAMAASQLSASGVKAGDDMSKALRAISGVASMTNSAYEEISPIFTTVAGQGKLMTMQLRQLEARGLNAAAELGKALGKTEQEVRDMVTKGKIDFKTFADAMDDAFGEHATESNKTFSGALRNMQFALKKIGAEFAGPLREAAIPFFNQVRMMINAIKDNISGLFPIFKDVVFMFSNILSNKIAGITNFLKNDFTGAENIANGFKNIVQIIIRWMAVLSTAFKEVFGTSKSVGDTVNNMAEGFESLTERLIPSTETLTIFKNILVVVLRTVKTVWAGIKPVFTMAGKIAGITLKIIGVIATLIGKLTILAAQLFKNSTLFKAMQAAGGAFNFIFQKTLSIISQLRSVFSDTSTVFGKFASGLKTFLSAVGSFASGTFFTTLGLLITAFNYIKNNFPAILDTVKTKITDFINRLKEIPIMSTFFNNIRSIVDKVKVGFTNLVNIIKTLFTYFKGGQTRAGGTLGPMADKMELLSKVGQKLLGVLKLLGSVAGAVMLGVASVFNTVMSVVRGLKLDDIIHKISELIQKIRDLELVKTAIDTFKSSGGNLIETFSAVVAKIREFISSMRESGVSVLDFFVEKIKNVISVVKEFFSSFAKNNMSEPLTRSMEGQASILDKFKEKFVKVKQVVTDVLTKIREEGWLTKILMVAYVMAILKALIQIPSSIHRVSKSLTGEGGLFSSFKNIAKGVSDFTTELTGGVKQGKGLLESLTTAVLDWGKAQRKTKIELLGGFLRDLAISVGILAASLAVLSLVPADRLKEVAIVLGIFSAVLIGLATAITLATKTDIVNPTWFNSLSANMLAMSIAIGILGGLLIAFANIDIKDIWQAITMLGVVMLLMVTMGAVMQIIGGLDFKGVTLRSAIFMIAFALSLKSIAKTLSGLSDIKIADINSFMAAMIALFVGMALVLAVSSGINPASALAIVAIVYALNKIITAFKGFIGEISSGEITALLAEAKDQIMMMVIFVSAMVTVLSIAALEIGAKLALAGASIGKGLLQVGAAFLLFGLGLMLIQSAIKKIANLDLLADDMKGLLNVQAFLKAIIISFAAILVLTKLLNGVDTALLKVAGAIALLSVAMFNIAIVAHIVKNLEWEPIWKALTILGVIMGAMALMVVAVKTGNGTLAFKTVIATVLGFTLLIGALMVLALMCGNDKVFEDLKRALVMILGLMLSMALVLMQVSKMHTGVSWKPILAMVVMLGAVFGALYLLSQNVHNWQDVAALGAIAGVIIGTIWALMALTKSISAFAKENNLGKSKAFTKVLAMVGIMLGAFIAVAAVLGLFAYATKDIDAGTIFVKAVAIIGVLGLLVMCAEKMTTTMKAVKMSDFGKFAAIMGAMLLAFAAVAAVVYLIGQLDFGEGLLTKVVAIGLVMAELVGLTILIGKFGTASAQTFKAIGALAVLTIVFGLVAGVCAVIGTLPMGEGLLAKTQTVMLVLTELIAINTLLGYVAKNSGQAALAAVALVPLVAVFGILAAVCAVIGVLPMNEGLLAKTQVVMLVLVELAAINALLGLLVGQEALGAVASVCLIPLIAIFGLLALVCAAINLVPANDGFLAKTQVIMLVLTELVAINALLGVLVMAAGVAALGAVGAICLIPLIAIFTLLAAVCAIINVLPIDGVQDKVRVVMNTLWEMVGMLAVLGVLAPLTALAMVAIPGLITICLAMLTLAGILKMLSGASVDGMTETLSMLTGALWELVGIGIVATAGSVGLVALGAAILMMGAACLAAGAGVMMFSEGIASLAATTPEQLEALQNVIITFCESIATGIVTIITSAGQAIVQQIMAIIEAIITALTGGVQAIIDIAGMMGTGLVEGFATTAMEIVKLPAEIISTLVSSLSGCITDLFNAGLNMGKSIVEGFRSGAMWHSPPVWEDQFFNDVETTAQTRGAEASQVLAEQGEKMGTFLETKFNETIGKWDFAAIKQKGLEAVENLVSGLKLGEGDMIAEVNWYNNMFGQLANARNLAAKGYSSTLGDYKYQKEQKRFEKVRERNAIDYVNGTKAQREEYIKLNKIIGEYDKEINKTAKAMGIGTQASMAFSDGLDQLGKSATGAGKAAGGAGKQMEDFATKLSDTLNSQMDIFSKFEKKQAMSKEELLGNMRSQIQGMAEWANDMKILAAKGIDKGLYEKLAMMGPQGAEYVGAFKEMTAEELAEANQLWAQSLVLPDQVAGEVAGAFNGIGTNIMAGWKNGIVDGTQGVVDAVALAGDQTISAASEHTGVQSPSWMTYDIGMYLMEGLHNGLSDYMERPISIMRIICETIINTAKRLLDPQKFYEIGKNIVLGLVRGLNDAGARSALNAAISGLSEEMQAATEALNEIQSPSKVYYRYGRYIVMGLANGISENSELATSAIKDMNQNNLDTMRETIRSIGDMVTEEMSDPVITPVLDLTNVSSGMRTLSNLFSTNQALSASASMNLQNAQLNGVVGNTVFNQYNYSPKALSRSEIYRQTKNQFSAYREAFR